MSIIIPHLGFLCSKIPIFEQSRETSGFSLEGFVLPSAGLVEKPGLHRHWNVFPNGMFWFFFFKMNRKIIATKYWKWKCLFPFEYPNEGRIVINSLWIIWVYSLQEWKRVGKSLYILEHICHIQKFSKWGWWLLRYSVVEFPNAHFHVTTQWTGIWCLMLGNGSVSHGFFQGWKKHSVGIYFSDGWLENCRPWNL